MKVGVIGTGAMGSGIATRLMETGHEVHVRDTSPERESQMAAAGATVQADPATLGQIADCIFIVVVTAAEIDLVLDGPTGLIAGLVRHSEPAAKTVVLCSTIAPEDTVRLAGKIEAIGAQVIDAPISGGPARALDGSMSMMMAGSDRAISGCQLVLDAAAAIQFRII